LARPHDKNDLDPTKTDIDLQPIGIRRWKLQKILYEAVLEEGITVHFSKRLDTIKELTDDTIHMRFEDGTTKVTKLLLAADGAKSKVRSIVTQGSCTLKYTGTTCLMGTSSTPRSGGLSLPSAPTTKCHGAFYPTGPDEQCFQFHFPVSLDNIQPQSMGGWGGMTHVMSTEECQELAKQLELEGWDEDQFLKPLENVQKALKIGLTTLDPPLQKFTFDRIILVGDAAHPPVPYLGQGAQQGLEDAGTLALLLKRFCMVSSDRSDVTVCLDNLKDASRLYNELRVPRAAEMVERGKLAGEQQQKRAENRKYNRTREELIKREVFYNENSKHLFPGVRHDYMDAVQESLQAFDVQEKQEKEKQRQEQRHHLTSVPEED
jgi:salicylate hydroxylase